MIRNGVVTILDDIRIDKKLLKYKIEEKDVTRFNSFEGGVMSDSVSFAVSRENDSTLDYLEYIQGNAPTLGNRFKLWLYKKLFSKRLQHKKDKDLITLSSIKKFFESVKENVNELDKKKIEDVLSKFDATLKNAKYNNQTSLIETLNDYTETLKGELILSISDFNKYLTEKDIVDFHNVASTHDKYKTGLCLTYVKNFVKVIPLEITELKRKADELKVFDNYVILHYDPSGKAVKDTKKEKEKKKDPILFGVIKGSKNLYYIGDWVDEYCDLTLDVIITKLGREASLLDTKRVKDNIDKL